MEIQLTSWPRSTLIGGSLGLVVGMAGTGLFILGIGLSFPTLPSHTPWIILPGCLLCPYIGMVAGIYISKLLLPQASREPPRDSASHISLPTSITADKLLDSSAIIDGRILPLCTTGFLDGPFVVAQCILYELQTLADSALPAKRIRGKRGLEILSRLQQLPNVDVRVIDDCEPTVLAVDHQLIALAKKIRGKIVTNDWNLAQIACLQGVPSLNVNELTYDYARWSCQGKLFGSIFIRKVRGKDKGSPTWTTAPWLLSTTGRSCSVKRLTWW